MGRRYCESCKKYVQGVRKPWSWAWFILGFGIFYFLYHFWFKGKTRCPVCGLDTKRKKENEE